MLVTDRPAPTAVFAGPVEKTVSDFWRLVWQEEVCKFIMAANLVEEGKVSEHIRLSRQKGSRESLFPFSPRFLR